MASKLNIKTRPPVPRLLYTPEEVSEMLGGIIKSSTIKEYCRRRIIKANKIARTWGIPEDGVKELLEKTCTK